MIEVIREVCGKNVGTTCVRSIAVFDPSLQTSIRMSCATLCLWCAQLILYVNEMTAAAW